MTDQGKPTTEDMLSLLLSMREYQSSPLTPLGEMQYEAIRARLAEHDGLARDLEQTRVQLAGCGVAALGYIQEPAKQGDYGWSASYQDVLKLRLEHDGLAGRLAKAEAALAEAEQPVSREWLRFQAGEIWSAKTIDDAMDTLADTLKGFGVEVEGEK